MFPDLQSAIAVCVQVIFYLLLIALNLRRTLPSGNFGGIARAFSSGIQNRVTCFHSR